MDHIDRSILRQLQADSSISNQDLAAKVGLSPSPCLRRVRALEASGAIRGYVALVDGESVGAGFRAFVEVRLEKQSEAFSNTFESTILRRDEVLECSFITGDYDYLLKVAVEDITAFHNFMTQVLGRLPGVANTRTMIPVKRIKETTALRIA
ncbi:AsnC family transcriptional regulator [Ruegeria marisrubri]|uniref:AsnC family transcriptional regulator n=1 Tax=Ruegeria marisrubri TaxID=1685379 RepID=A0A117KHD1_9RHOB|nr:Lrp/AsnC family transcriptional regulator [Ruegeria marisrubri]KUJ86173.1 AsnC family transcriptional regulator [Ruegeria marisrubri]